MHNQPFPGFPAKASFTPLPNLFFTALLHQIDSLVELRLILHVFWQLYPKRGWPKFVTYGELAADQTLMAGMEGTDPPAEVLRHALALAVSDGVFLHLALDKGGESQDIYFVNTESNKEAIAKLKGGEISLGALPPEEPYVKKEKPNIFALYEQNIGILTPMIAEELKAAEKVYPAAWIEEAFKEAVSRNKRSWRYVARILERWSSEGKESGEFRRDLKKEKVSSLKGRYGHLVRR